MQFCSSKFTIALSKSVSRVAWLATNSCLNSASRSGSLSVFGIVCRKRFSLVIGIRYTLLIVVWKALDPHSVEEFVMTKAV